MRQKKARRANDGKQPKLLNHASRIAQDIGGIKTYGVRLYKQGIKTEAFSPRRGKRMVGGGRRGKVEGWSKASRRRMREWMLTRYVPDAHLVGGNFTIPGLPMPAYPEQKKLWVWFCREVERRGWGMVWRMEVQARGALHWHSLIYIPKTCVLDWRAPRVEVKVLWETAIRECLEKPFRPDPPIKTFRCRNNQTGKVYFDEWIEFGSRMSIPGASAHAAHCDDGTECHGAWLRYLQDHSSKTKQEQIAVGMGRHWGVVGRKRFVVGQQVEGYDLSPRQYFRFLRAFQRLCTPSFKVEGKPFGRKLGDRVKRGRIGNAVWFSRSDTIRRIVEWAIRTVREEKEHGAVE